MFRLCCESQHGGQEEQAYHKPHRSSKEDSAKDRISYIDSRCGGGILQSHVAGIQAAGDAWVGGAFDDRAAIREHRQLIRVDTGADRKIIGAHRSQRGKSASQIPKIHWTRTFVDLHRIAAAQADGRATLARQMDEIPAGAAWATGIASRGGRLADFA